MIATEPWNSSVVSRENTELQPTIELETEVSIEHDEYHLHSSEPSHQERRRVEGLQAFQQGELIAANNGYDPRGKPNFRLRANGIIKESARTGSCGSR